VFTQQFAFRDAAAVHREYVQLTQGRPCDQSGISYDSLRTLGPQQWPCPLGHSGGAVPRLYADHQFHTENKRAYFCLDHAQGLAEPVDDQYPWVLTNGRLYGHWHTQTRTGHIAKIQKMHPHPFLEIHPQDAETLGLKPEDWVLVKSRRGHVHLPVHITSVMPPGTVFMPMHWGALWAEQAEVNSLTHPLACPISKQPELKACAVQIIPLQES
jgi:ferredoxin-nitrate reductase